MDHILGSANTAVNPNDERYEKFVGHGNPRLCVEHGDQLMQSSNLLKWPANWRARKINQETALNGGIVGSSLETSSSSEGPQKVIVAAPSIESSAEKSDEINLLKNIWVGNGALKTIIDKIVHPVPSPFPLRRNETDLEIEADDLGNPLTALLPKANDSHNHKIVSDTNVRASQPSCCCHTAKLDDIVSKVGDLYSEISSLVRDFKDQNPCNPQIVHTVKYSIPSHTEKSFNSPECADAKAVFASPYLQKMCHIEHPLQPTPAPPVFDEETTPFYVDKQNTKVDPSYKEDFLSYMDFIKMLKDVNQNSETLTGGTSGEITNIKHPDEQAHHEHKKATFRDQFSKYLETYEHQPFTTTTTTTTTEKPKVPKIADLNAKFQSLFDKYKLKL